MNPKKLNYKMPPEWEEHERTFMSWPVKDSMCYPEDYEFVCENYYKELAKVISEFEKVTVIVNNGEKTKVKSIINNEKVDFLEIDHNDAWLRDNGPTFVKDSEGKVAGVNWEFNAWGGKYTPWDLDNKVAPAILENLGIDIFNAPIVMEGGSIHVDGEGTVITTEECLLNKTRNPHLNKDGIEDYLKEYLNVEKVIWLKKGLFGDETDGHVDNIACFAAPGKIIIQVCEDTEDENYKIAEENLTILENSLDAKGRKFEIIKIPQPPKKYYDENRLTLSYLNFYFVNKGIILPVFGGDASETDKKAEEILINTFPDRKIRKINGMTIIKEGGNVHCTTQQMPKIG
ncbi:agmatine deiminase family protein [Clostridium grantii]|uniref:Putative agmatine deiminase n=1 Tax=Clostridium grantii DSM 8605 TaxID=1121316 RepID=A0A1M5QJS6_9CLOT|nr:agmatine deiminase family protein [Clostridium grantii]SHH14030.1 agmatine deiminase [Clostridium grantii DSM 8605]